MNSEISWMNKQNHLAKLIKKVSYRYGGDEEEFLKVYQEEVINRYAKNLEVAIICFESLIPPLEIPPLEIEDLIDENDLPKVKVTKQSKSSSNKSWIRH